MSLVNIPLIDDNTYIKERNIDHHEYYFNNHYDESYPPSKKHKPNPIEKEYMSDTEFEDLFDMSKFCDTARVEEEVLSYVPWHNPLQYHS